jgi:CHAD domain-containing protein
MRRLTSTLNASAGNGQVLLASKAISIALPAGTLRHLDSALKKQWRRYRKALKYCQKTFSPAAVHNSRVETRRLLSIIGLVSPFLARGRAHKIQALLKQHLDSFDDLRDTQVQLFAVEKMKRSFGAAVRFCEYLRKREKHFAREIAPAVKEIRTRRLGKLLVACRDDLKAWRQTDLAAAANALLLRMVHAAFARTQRLREQIDSQDPLSIHRTRVAFKRFRYMVEILAGDLPRVDKSKLRAMHDYQTAMGEIQDAQVLLEAFEEFRGKKKIPAPSAHSFREHLLSRRTRLIQAYLGVSEQLLTFWPLPATSPQPAARGSPPRANAGRGGDRRTATSAGAQTAKQNL